MSANVIVTFLKSPTRKATAILVIISLIIYLKRRLQSKLYIPSLQVLSRLNSRLINHYAKFPKRQIQHSRNAYLRGSLHGKGKLEYGHSHYDRESKKLIFFAVLGDEICGHQGIVHGGMVAGIFDDIFGELFYSHADKKYLGFTANLSINYRSKMPSNSVIVFICFVDRQEGRKVYVKGVAKSVDVDEVSEEFGKVESLVYAEAEALFIIPREEFNKLPQPYSPTIAI